VSSTTETSKVHAFIDGVLLGLAVSAYGREEAIGRFIEVVEHQDTELGEFAKKQAKRNLKEREQDLVDTFEVIYWTI